MSRHFYLKVMLGFKIRYRLFIFKLGHKLRAPIEPNYDAGMLYMATIYKFVFVLYAAIAALSATAANDAFHPLLLIPLHLLVTWEAIAGAIMIERISALPLSPEYSVVIDLALATGARDIGKMKTGWHYQLGEWQIIVNGSAKPIVENRVKIDPYEILVFYQNEPVANINIEMCSGVNFDSEKFLADVRNETERLHCESDG